MSGLVDPDHGISRPPARRKYASATGRASSSAPANAAHCEASRRSPCSSSTRPSTCPTRRWRRCCRPRTAPEPPDHLHGHPARARDNGEAFTRLRDKARAGRTHSTLYVEFTADRDADPSTATNGGKPTPATRPTPATNPSPTCGKTSPAMTSGAKPSASGTNTPSAKPSTAANGRRKPPSSAAAPAAS